MFPHRLLASPCGIILRPKSSSKIRASRGITSVIFGGNVSLPLDSPPARLADHAVAMAYAGIPLRTFAREKETISQIIGRSKSLSHKLISSEVAYLTGQADLMLRLEVRDLRPVVELPYPNELSHARVVNWVFSVPYEDPTITTENSDVRENGFRFVLHGRLRRGLFAVRPVERETKIVDAIRRRFPSGVAAKVHVGLGWSDLIVDGTFAARSFDDFASALVSVHDAHVSTDNGPFPVFERTLTVVGYVGDAPDIANLRPLIFVRAAPGKLNSMREHLAASLGVQADDVHVIDGKSDILIIPSVPVASDVLARAERLSHNRSAHDAARIQRLETHLIFGNAATTSALPLAIEFSDANEIVDACTCLAHPKSQHRFDPDTTPYLPDELRHAVANVRFLFRASLAEETTCCDVAPAVAAAERGLMRLGNQLDSRYGELEASKHHEPHDQPRFHEGLIDHHKQIELWVLLSERILRQRTVGSFEEILGQTDRAVSYRGSVQKFLSLADSLMNDFARDVLGLRSTLPIFASLYDSVSAICSQRSTGFVRIPVKHLFRLPLLIPDLWHEVGAYAFFSDSRTQDLLQDAHAASKTAQFLYRDFADYYADLIVYLYGFRENFLRVSISLIRGWLEANPSTMPEPVRHQNYAQLLFRLYHLFEFRARRMGTLPYGTSVREKNVRDTVAELDAFVHQTFPHKAPTLDAGILDVVVDVLGTPRYRLWTKHEVMLDLTHREIPSQKSSRSRIADLRRGDLVDFGDAIDMNAVFGDFYWEAEWRRLKLKHFEGKFRGMAALGRSATIEYHRRLLRYRVTSAAAAVAS
jgi:hypothetical protein